MISSGHDRRVKKIIFTIPAQADVRRIDRETAMRILTALHRFAETGEGDEPQSGQGDGAATTQQRMAVEHCCVRPLQGAGAKAREDIISLRAEEVAVTRMPHPGMRRERPSPQHLA